jgi:hypothetical protein
MKLKKLEAVIQAAEEKCVETTKAYADATKVSDDVERHRAHTAKAYTDATKACVEAEHNRTDAIKARGDAERVRANAIQAKIDYLRFDIAASRAYIDSILKLEEWDSMEEMEKYKTLPQELMNVGISKTCR